VQACGVGEIERDGLKPWAPGSQSGVWKAFHSHDAQQIGPVQSSLKLLNGQPYPLSRKKVDRSKDPLAVVTSVWRSVENNHELPRNTPSVAMQGMQRRVSIVTPTSQRGTIIVVSNAGEVHGPAQVA